MPSPTIATGPRSASSASTARSLSSGSIPARYSSAPTRALTPARDPLGVAREHDHAPDAGARAAPRDRGGRLRTRLVGEPEDRQRAVALAEHHRGLPARLEPQRVLGHARRGARSPGAARRPTARGRRRGRRRRGRAAPRSRPPSPTARPRSRAACDERLGQRVLGALARPPPPARASPSSEPPSSAPTWLSTRPADGQRAGLVDRDGPDAREVLQRLAALDEHAVAGGAADRGDDRDRDGDDQRARARDDQQRQRPVQPGVDARRRTARPGRPRPPARRRTPAACRRARSGRRSAPTGRASPAPPRPARRRARASSPPPP